MDTRLLRIIITLVLGLGFAIYLGVAVALDQVEAVSWVLGIGVFVILLALGRHIWALIPLALCLDGALNFLPGAPSVWYVATPLATCFLLLRFLSRTKDFTWRWTWMDTMVFLNLLLLIQAYMRNPTGLAILGGGGGGARIGGKTYVDFYLVTIGYFVLGSVRSEWKYVRVVLYCMIGLQLFDGLLGAATGFSGSLAALVSKVYGNVDYTSAIAGLEGGITQGYTYDINTRFITLTQIGLVLGTICFTLWRPISCLNPTRPFRGVLLILTLVATLMSGFRSNLTRIVFLFIAGCVARRRPFDLAIAGGCAFLLLCTVMLSGIGMELPFAAQRALSFLPVGVSEDAKKQAQESSEWRFEMWRLALSSDRYIRNKIFGDGFGFTAAELKVANDPTINLSGQAQMEYYMSKGSYHGFHVECIRFVGAVGLIIATVILFVFGAKAWQLIRYFDGRQGWPALLYVCVPYLMQPAYYWLVFGSYKGNFMTYVLGGGLLKLLDNIRVRELAEEIPERSFPGSDPATDTWDPLRGPLPGGRPAVV